MQTHTTRSFTPADGALGAGQRGEAGTAVVPFACPLVRSDRAERIAAAWLLGYSSQATRRAYANDIANWGEWLAHLGIGPLAARRPHVEAWARWLEQQGRSAATVARALSAVGSFYHYAQDEGLIDRSPVANVRRPQVQDDSPTLGLDVNELGAMVAAAEATSPRNLALVLLLGMNGLRISEALGADVEALSTERGHRTLAITRKGGRRALVPLAPRTAAALDSYLAGRATGPLFTTSTGGRLDAAAAARTIRRLAKRAGIRKTVSPHSLRHSFVTLALDAGASLRDVQDAAGHADPRTTRRYDRGRNSLDRHPTYAVAAKLQ